MIIEIDVPETTLAIFVNAVIGTKIPGSASMASRCFKIEDGKAKDETGENKVCKSANLSYDK